MSLVRSPTNLALFSRKIPESLQGPANPKQNELQHDLFPCHVEGPALISVTPLVVTPPKPAPQGLGSLSDAQSPKNEASPSIHRTKASLSLDVKIQAQPNLQNGSILGQSQPSPSPLSNSLSSSSASSSALTLSRGLQRGTTSSMVSSPIWIKKTTATIKIKKPEWKKVNVSIKEGQVKLNLYHKIKH